MQNHATEYLMLRYAQQNHLFCLNNLYKNQRCVLNILEFEGVLVVSISPFALVSCVYCTLILVYALIIVLVH